MSARLRSLAVLLPLLLCLICLPACGDTPAPNGGQAPAQEEQAPLQGEEGGAEDSTQETGAPAEGQSSNTDTDVQLPWVPF